MSVEVEFEGGESEWKRRRRERGCGCRLLTRDGQISRKKARRGEARRGRERKGKKAHSFGSRPPPPVFRQTRRGSKLSSPSQLQERDTRGVRPLKVGMMGKKKRTTSVLTFAMGRGKKKGSKKSS